VQFHPTALDVGLDPMPLVSEAVRGEGATLINGAGERFMAGQGRAELEPRDIVSRAVWAQMQLGHQVFLDARQALGTSFASRFPAIAAACHAAGIDPGSQPIPIRPAAHYFMGGIAVDARGRSSIAGLWACGEAASTGLHGANRLASNSLLEAAICGQSAGRAMAAMVTRNLSALRDAPLPPEPDAAPGREIMSTHLGVLRDRPGLERAVAEFSKLAPANQAAALALRIAEAALARPISAGAHAMRDEAALHKAA